MKQNGFNFLLLMLWAVCSFSITANGQTSSSYRFLEVKDTEGKPVEGATVKTQPNRSKIEQTDENGRLKQGLQILRGDFNTRSFSVSKAGYFDYEDLGAVSGYFALGSSEPIRLELLIVPKTTAERTAIENEQRKRDFFLAAKRGDSVEVQNFLQMGLSANLTTDDLRGVPIAKDVPLIAFAAASGDGETVSSLLDAGAELRSRNQAENEILIYYLSTGINMLYLSPNTAEEVRKVEQYEEGLRKLIEANANVKAVQNGTNYTTLIIAARSKSLRIIKKLLDNGAPINAEDSYGNTALTEAIRYERKEIVDLLLKSGAVRKPQTDKQVSTTCRNPVLDAVYANDLTALQSLIAKKADVNQTCPGGESALLRAVINKRIKAIELLIAAGASVTDGNGQRALEIARERKFSDILHYQVDYKIIVDLLEAAGARQSSR